MEHASSQMCDDTNLSPDDPNSCNLLTLGKRHKRLMSLSIDLMVVLHKADVESMLCVLQSHGYTAAGRGGGFTLQNMPHKLAAILEAMKYDRLCLSCWMGPTSEYLSRTISFVSRGWSICHMLCIGMINFTPI